ncbi:hypothetical protein GQ597_09335 [Gilliamella sp. Pra-s65]|uniref:hypothetical protein n=1 Tax=unclassified Gilliamella TaxID=2685620 RepID=UPI0013652672|nr:MULTISPECIES: hypothetical protein [unclassified Gilliamella]MWN90902.1 hypothetical protein [Gilliamella sp. Pra-s65]MWP73841.1 hypothetical protein [Gilliamella sp. Pra-s52]
MMNFLQNIMGLAVFAAFIIGLMTFVGLFILLLCYVIIKQVKSDKRSDKISDEILTQHYNMLKKHKDNVFLAFLCYGILYMYGMKLNQKVFEAYKECMIRRNLPL